jgi:hypothetical protein
MWSQKMQWAIFILNNNNIVNHHYLAVIETPLFPHPFSGGNSGTFQDSIR